MKTQIGQISDGLDGLRLIRLKTKKGNEDSPTEAPLKEGIKSSSDIHWVRPHQL